MGTPVNSLQAFMANTFGGAAVAALKPAGGSPASATPAQAQEFLTDSWQRGVLFLDVLRQRGNEQEDMASRPMATVLTFAHEIIMSGRSLPRPMNYSLSRILLPEGVTIDPKKAPVVVIDPRAGQGPGIGGFKTVSEIGEALKNGHQVYFIGFAAEPVEGQTFLDVVEGQVAFFERIAELHPDAPKPFAIGNCQAGYQTLMVAMQRPDLFGPAMVAGSPMSYWQGEHGKNPMRYSGGLLGGSWLTALVSDLSGGKFDGAWLILNFDNLNPANWLWDKQYQLYSEIDSDAARYLQFEKWWGDFIKLNGVEIQYLVDELFIGDKLTRNALTTREGKSLDLRNITSPLIVLTSLGDNISPPPQTLGWILDLYEDVDALRNDEKTVIYCVNPTVGHLAIFVSAKVGGKEDEEMVRLLDFLDCVPPGLYELVITPSSDEETKAGGPPWLTRLEMRTFDDLRAFGRNSEDDDRAFETVKRMSEVNHALYETFMQPFVKAVSTPQLTEALFKYNPLRLSYAAFADGNPFMKNVARMAEDAKKNRTPAAADNPFVAAQNQMTAQIDTVLNGYRDVRDAMVEKTFFAVYANPVLQSFYGVTRDFKARSLPPQSPEALARIARRAAAIEAKRATGGFNEALVRAALYVAYAERSFDDRAAAVVAGFRRKAMHLDLPAFKALVKEQFEIVATAREKAIVVLGALVPGEDERRRLLSDLTAIFSADGAIAPAEQKRIDEIAAIFARAAGAPVARLAPPSDGSASMRRLQAAQTET